MKRNKIQKHKLLFTAVSMTAAAAILLTGTFAWQSISQTAMNKVKGDANPGGRLHDDFDGTNKDIYVENFTSKEENGVPIFARVRLDEYMELGPGAGESDGERTGIEVIGKADARLADPDTWLTHKMAPAEEDEDTTTAETAFHEYWSWDMGGTTVYMPTFNKNKDSLAADINGTYEGTLAEDQIHYDDYHAYEEGEEKIDDAVYDADDDTVDEGENAQEGTDITIKGETHTAAETLDSEVLTMEEWKAMDSPVGAYWVYDVDGWAYWAQPIEPGTATGLLLDGIQLNKEPDEEWYYAINVVGQFATSGDWGDKEKSDGFYEDGITDDALFLLNQAAGRLPRVESMRVEGGYKQYAKAGETMNLQVNMTVTNGTGAPEETYVIWSSEPETNALAGTTFTPTKRMVGKTYRLTATSVYDPEKSAFVDVFVYPADAVGVVTGYIDKKKTYVDYGDNTFKEILKGGGLGEFICGGADEKAGSSDDRKGVTVLEMPDPTFGSKFLATDDENTYWAVGDDGKLGTADDVKVIGDPWPDNLTSTLADHIEISAASGAETVKVGKRLKLSAKVTRKGEKIANQDVTWSVAGNDSEETKIDEQGILSIGDDEVPKTVLTISAESQEMKGLNTSIKITVDPLDYTDLDSITPGSLTTVTIDGSDWYVLAKQNNKVLIFSESILEERAFGSTNNWESSPLRTYLNDTWLKSKATLKEHVVPTEIETRKTNNSDDWDKTIDSVFLLSEADVVGTVFVGEPAKARDYTLGREEIILPEELRAKKSNWWTRSPGSSAGYGALVNPDKNVGRGDTSYARGVRPALWVNLES